MTSASTAATMPMMLRVHVWQLGWALSNMQSAEQGKLEAIVRQLSGEDV